MIYRFYFEGGSMDGEVVLLDCSQASEALPQPDAWIDFTLGGVVGLYFPVSHATLPDHVANQTECRAGTADGEDQIYQVVYRDEVAGTVIVRCRYVPWVDLVPPGIRRIVFSFEGGVRDGATDISEIAGEQSDRRRNVAQNRYRLTENGTVGRRFGAGSEAALAMLKSDGPDATHSTAALLHIYAVMSRKIDGEDLLLNCQFIRSECRAA